MKLPGCWRHETSDEYAELCDYIRESLKNGELRPDYSLTDAMNIAFKKLRLVPLETLQLVRATIDSGTNRRQRVFLRQVLKSRINKKIVENCHYLSLAADGVPHFDYISIASFIKAGESGEFESVASSVEERVGAAHALLAFRYDRSVTTAYLVNELVARYPEVFRVFAQNNERVVHLHDFIAERNLSLARTHDVELLRNFATSAASSLASGSL